MNPVEAFLMTIRFSEGTEDSNGYRRIVGLNRALINDFVKHPNILVDINNLGIKSTAAGAYQFIFKTWETYRVKLGLPDFSPESQDKAAHQLLIDCGAVDFLIGGDIVSAMVKAGREWASVPGASSGQVHLTAQQWIRQFHIYLGG